MAEYLLKNASFFCFHTQIKEWPLDVTYFAFQNCEEDIVLGRGITGGEGLALSPVHFSVQLTKTIYLHAIKIHVRAKRSIMCNFLCSKDDYTKDGGPGVP